MIAGQGHGGHVVECATFSLYGVMREYRPVNKRYVGAVKDYGGLAVFHGGSLWV